MLASALYQVADGIFISRILGDTAFAGFNLAMPLVIINFALADLIGLGSAVPISIKLGSKDEKEANNYFTCASIMVVLAGILSGAVLALGGRTFLSLDGRPGGAAGPGHSVSGYLRPLLPGHHHCLCRGQLPAHLREDPPQHDPEHLHVCGLHGL